MTIESELERARQLAFAADEIAAKELLLSLGEGIEEGDRDDLLLEVFAQLGELYLVRTAYDGVEKCLRRMREIMAVHSAIRAGTRPDADVQGTIANVDIDRMILRYSRRAQFLETGLAAAHGDHESAEVALLVLTDETSAAAFADLADEHAYLVTHARIMCAVALCDDDLHVRSVLQGVTSRPRARRSPPCHRKTLERRLKLKPRVCCRGRTFTFRETWAARF